MHKDNSSKREPIDAISAPTCWISDDEELPSFPPAGVPASESDIDTKTGATPGVSAACKELGMSDPGDVQKKFGIKPPGEL